MSAAGLDVIPAQVAERLEETDLLPIIGDIHGVICGDDRFTARVFDAAPNLRVIAKWGTGIDSIDLAAAAARGVRVCNTPGAFTEPVTDSVFCYLLAFARALPPTLEQMRSGGWQKLPGRTLRECTLGIIGVGDIGSAVARRAAAFGMRMLGTDPRGIPPALAAETGLVPATFEQTLAEADFVTLHCDLNSTSWRMIDRRALSLMKPSAVLINTSRGPVVDEEALIAALQERRLAGAALDVFEHEPLPGSSPLRAMPNVLLAPHNANSSPAAWSAVHASTLNQLLQVLTESGR
jgi:D-3-phosphoglycerate dehydrogenase